jgi:hypothetical protein
MIQVVPDRKHVSFRYSYPNYIPLPASAVERIVRAVGPFEYDRAYGAFRPGRQGGGAAVGGAASAGDWGLTKSGPIHRAPVVPSQEAAVAE